MKMPEMPRVLAPCPSDKAKFSDRITHPSLLMEFQDVFRRTLQSAVPRLLTNGNQGEKAEGGKLKPESREEMRQLIDAGYVYIAQPPLYRVSTGKVTRYAQNEAERERIIKDFNVKNLSVQRFKGLGEMNAAQLWETTMNPETRTLLRVDSENASAADEIFTMLMGEKVAPRKDFIKTEARKVRNLDI